jgi:hypothetical protein
MEVVRYSGVAVAEVRGQFGGKETSSIGSLEAATKQRLLDTEVFE